MALRHWLIKEKGSSIDFWQSSKYATGVDNTSDVKVNIVLDTSFLKFET